MAITHGKQGTVTWDGNTQANITNWNLSLTADTAESTAMDSAGDWKEFKVGFKDWTATVDINIDTTGPLIGTDAALGELGASATLVLSDGTDTYTGTALALDFGFSGSIGDVAKATYSFQGTSSIT